MLICHAKTESINVTCFVNVACVPILLVFKWLLGGPQSYIKYDIITTYFSFGVQQCSESIIALQPLSAQ